MITFFTALRKVAPDAKVAIVLIDYANNLRKENRELKEKLNKIQQIIA